MEDYIDSKTDDIESRVILKSAMEAATAKVFEFAKRNSLRRGSLVIREIDVEQAILMVRIPQKPKWYLIPVAGNGGCLCK